METIAVYWESKIKTYEFNKLTNLYLFEITYPEEKTLAVVSVLSDAGLYDVASKFMVLQKPADGFLLAFCLLEADGKDFCAFLENNSTLVSYQYVYPVGILYFHGPHFGDRYGIADAVYSPLQDAAIHILSSGCSSASVFLVVAEDDLKRAEEVLRRRFDPAKQ